MRSVFKPALLAGVFAVGASAVIAGKLENAPAACLAVSNPCDSSSGLDTTYMTMDPNVQKTVVSGDVCNACDKDVHFRCSSEDDRGWYECKGCRGRADGPGVACD